MARGLTLSGWLRAGDNGPLVVYIEGDGYAWATRTAPSRDPTPRDPVALRLAVRDGSARVLYLARPCQYVGGVNAPGCQTSYWTTQRFAPDLIDAMDQALDAAKSDSGASRLVLVGYSGGAATALLLAARRMDVAGLITVAGVLDHQAWTDLHGVTPLSGSLNPIDVVDAVIHLPQLHIAGSDDRVVPPALVSSFAARSGSVVVIVPGMTHQGDWSSVWPELRAQLPAWPGS